MCVRACACVFVCACVWMAVTANSPMTSNVVQCTPHNPHDFMPMPTFLMASAYGSGSFEHYQWLPSVADTSA